MSDEHYFLASCPDRNQLLSVADSLHANENITEYYAVDGHHDFIAKVANVNTTVEDSLRTIVGIERVEFCNVSSQTDNSDDSLNELCKSFALLELEKDSLKTVTNKLNDITQIKILSQTSGSYDMVLLVADDNFDSVDNLIMKTIRSFDGVLRVKQDRVIDLTEL